MFLAKKNFEYHERDQKCHFGKIEKLPKWHFWTCAWNSKFFLAKIILLKHYENGNKKKYSQLVPGSTKSRIYAVQSTKRGFSKKGLTIINFFFLFLVPMNLPKAWDAKLGAGSFFAFKKTIQEVWTESN